MFKKINKIRSTSLPGIMPRPLVTPQPGGAMLGGRGCYSDRDVVVLRPAGGVCVETQAEPLPALGKFNSVGRTSLDMFSPARGDPTAVVTTALPPPKTNRYY